MVPELIACIETGVVLRVVKGGAPMGSKVTSARYDKAEHLFVVEVDDGIDGDRWVVFERVDGPMLTDHLRGGS
jgi:hypothetical protein